MRIVLACILACCATIHASYCLAMQPVKVFRQTLVIEGKIERGDYNKLRRFLSHRATFDKIENGVFLASPGGDVMEAIRIGYLLRSLELRTLLPASHSGTVQIAPRDLKNPADYLCASACFFLYVAGIDRNPPDIGRLGIHRPIVKSYFNVALSKEKREHAAKSVEDILSYYVHQMDVPEQALSLMLSVPPDTVHWMTGSEFSQYVRWTSPEFAAQVQRECKTSTEDRTSFDAAVCRRRVAIRLSAQGWAKTFGVQ